MKKDKSRRKRNIIGAAVMAGLILLSMPLGVAHSLEDLREDAEGEFYGDRAGFSIYRSLEERRAAAQNLLTIARKYTEDNPGLSVYVDELEYRVRENENAYDDTFYWEGETNLEMGEAARALAQELEKLDLSEKDRKYPAQLIAQMDSEQDKIERSSYNDAARQFNSRLQVFPVNILRGFTDVKELIPFDEHGAMAEEADVIEQAEYFAEAEGLDDIPEVEDIPEAETVEEAP